MNTTRPEWRIVSVAPEYEVSNTGVVRRVTPHHRCPKAYPSGYVVPQWELNCKFKRKDGTTLVKRYKSVSLFNAGEGRTRGWLVHRLVTTAFHGEPPTTKHQAAHGDGNSLNNNAYNLRWATAAENQADRIEHGTSNKGSAHGMAKLTEDDVRIIRQRLRGDETQSSIARDYAVSPGMISMIALGRSWKHVE